MARIKVDLHDIYNNTAAIDNALQQAFDDAIEKRSVKWRSSPAKAAESCEKK